MTSVQTVHASFEGGSNTIEVTATFPGTVESAAVALQGFALNFPGGQNHQISNIQVQPSVSNINGDSVTVQITMQMNDDSNHFAGGSVYVLVLANLAQQ